MTTRILFLLGLLAAAPARLSAQDCTLEVVSLDMGGAPANHDSASRAVSYDGRFVAFASAATDLVPGDTNGKVDCFVVDRRSGLVERVSVSSAGAQANGTSWECRLSADGRFVSFLSFATNLDPKDTDTVQDVYLHDRVSKTTVLVSERFGTGPTSMGCTSANVSADGRWVLFHCTDANVLPNVLPWNAFVRDTWLGTTELVSIGPAGQVEGGASGGPHMSGDGRFVVFHNDKLHWGTPSTGATGALWLRDRQLGTTTLVTATPSGEIADWFPDSPYLSYDGRFAVFRSHSTNLLPPDQPHGVVDIVRWDRLTGEFVTASTDYLGAGLTNQVGIPSVSDDGSTVVYYSSAVNVTPGPQISQSPYLVDLDTATTRNLLWNAAGDIANANSIDATISGDGRTAVINSNASNLVRGITTNAWQIYVRTCDRSLPMAYCVPTKGSTGCAMRIGSTGDPSASAGSGFQVRLEKPPAQAPLLLFYGTSGDWGTPYGNGWLCVKSPLKRAVAGASGYGATCAATWTTDFNSFVASGVDGDLVAGAVVHMQGWARNSAGEGQLSDALALVLEP